MAAAATGTGNGEGQGGEMGTNGGGVAMVKASRKRIHVERPRAPGAPYSIEQAAAFLGLAPRTVRARIAEGLLKHFRDGRRVFIAEAAIVEYDVRRKGEAADLLRGTGLAVRRHLRPRGRRDA